MVNHNTDPLTNNLIAAMDTDARQALAHNSVTLTPIDPVDGEARYRLAGVVSVILTSEEAAALIWPRWTR